MHASADQQGVVQGMITGMRGLCNGLGPAMFGLIFSLFHVDLTEKDPSAASGAQGHYVHPSPSLNMSHGQVRLKVDQNQSQRTFFECFLLCS